MHAQDWKLILEMVVMEDGNNLSGAEVNVYRDGKFVEKVTSDSKGRVDVNLKPGGLYEVAIGGSKNYIKKKLQISTQNIPPEDVAEDRYFPAEVDIFKKLDGLNYAILEKPIGKIYYNPDKEEFDVDLEYTASMKSQLQKLQDDYLAQKAKEAELQAQKKKEYDDAIKVADKALKDEEWEKAAEYYEKAEKLQPMETYPSFQLAELKTKLVKIKQQNEQYNTAIQLADEAFKNKDYLKAKSEYQSAVNIKPGDEHAQNRLQESQDLLANAAKVEQNYLAAIEKGDNSLKVNELQTAKTAFEEAAKLKPSETYPQNKLSEIERVLAKQNAEEEEYQQTIKTADEALAAKNYEAAKSAYAKAATLKPVESYPKDQIAKVEGLMAEAAKVEQNYLAAVEKGDNALTANNYEGAKVAFQEAAKIKPTEEYPQNKIQEIENYLAKNAAKEEEYKNKVEEADQLLADKNYETAKSTYEAAAKLKPQESYPKDKIGEIETTLAQLAKKEENYKTAITKGDEALAAENYEAAKAAYNEALAIKAEESYPKEKLSEIQTIVLKVQQADEEYNKSIANADKALEAKEYEKAKGFYEQATSLKSEEQYPKDQIAQIEKTLTEMAANEKAYTAAIDEADAAKGSGNLETAITAYEKALGLKPDASYPQKQIDEIQTKLAEQQAKEEKYQKAIAKGDQSLATEDYQTAKSAYEEALTIKDDDYPRGKIGEIESILAQQQEKEAAYLASIEKGDAAFENKKWEEAKTAYEAALNIKKDEYPQSKLTEIDSKLAEIAANEEAAAKLEANYQAAISEGDQKLQAGELEAAKAFFEKAADLKTEEAYPKTKIEEITAQLEKLAEEKLEKERLAALEKQYNELIAKADQAFAAEDLNGARKLYQEALAVKSEESYPQMKIEEINNTLADAEQQDQAYQNAIASADALLSDQKLEEAKKKYAEAASIKSSEQYPKDKMKEIDGKLVELAAKQEEIRLKQEQKAETEAQYQALLAEADQLFEEKDFKASKAKYQEALAVKTYEYPKQKIQEIDTRLAELATAKEQEQAAAEQAKIDAKYQGLIAEADGMLENDNLEDAKSKYQEALTVKSEAYPQQKIDEINNRLSQLANQEAAEEAAAEQAKIDAEYQGLVAEADQLFEASKFEKAKSKYREALTVKNEEYPQNKIKEIDSKLTAMESEKLAEQKAAEQAKKEAAFQAAIAEGDALLAEGELEKAKEKFIDAIGIKEDPYPANKIAQIDEQLDKQASEAAKEESLAQLEADYQKAIQSGDESLNKKSYQNAIDAYQKALNLKPEETYPQTKIAEAQTAMQAQKESLAEDEAAYQQAIAQADALMEEKNYKEAIASYEKALEIKNETYPNNQIQKAKDAINTLASRQEEIKLQQEREAQNEAAYQEAIATADQLFTDKNYDRAKGEYEKAKGFKPSMPYPQNQIDRINEVQSDRESAIAAAKQAKIEAAEIEEQYQEAISKADQAYDSDQLYIAKREYSKAIQLKSNENYPKVQLDKVVSEMEAQQLADAEKRKEDEKIVIQKGPKSTIDGDAEAEIDQMYKEIWAEKEAEKKRRIEEKEEAVAKYSDKRREEEEKKRKNALERIEGISVSLSEQNKETKALNLQNYETVKQKEDAQKEFHQEKRRDNERKRNDAYADAERNAENWQKKVQNKVEEKYDGLKEDVEKQYEAQQQAEQSRKKEQIQRNEKRSSELEEKVERMQAYQKKLADEQLTASSSTLEDKQEAWSNSQQKYTQSSQERISDRHADLVKKEEKLLEQNHERSQSYQKGQSNLEEREKAYAANEKERIESSQSRIDKKQAEINEQIENQKEMASSKRDSYKTGQETVEEKEKALEKQKKEWTAESEKRRSDKLDKEYYSGEAKPREDQEAANYPQGVSEKIIEGENSTTIRRTVVDGTQVDIYEKTLHNYGGVFYTKNGENITEELWDQESR
jgi:tetratricopeptide (TPR) repeat protein